MDQTAMLSSAEEQLRNYGRFVNEYEKRLQTILEKNQKSGSREKPVSLEPLIVVNYAGNQEALTPLKLLESDRLLNKVLLTFAHLCEEVRDICSDAQRMQMQFLYLDEELYMSLGDGSQVDELAAEGQSSGGVLLKMSGSIGFLCQLHFLLQRCILLGNNLLHQCGALLAMGCSETSMALEFRMFHVYDYLAELLRHLAIFDEILATSSFCRFWRSYKRTVEGLSRSSLPLPDCTHSELSGLQNCLTEFDFLFTGTIFRHFLDSTFSLKEKIGPRALGLLTQQFNDYLKQQLSAVDRFSDVDLDDFSETAHLVRLNALCVVCHDFCGQLDGKQLKHLLEVNTKRQGIMLVCNVAWSPGDFLRKNAASLVKSYDKALLDGWRQRQLFVQARCQTLSRDCRTFCTQIALWTVNVDKALRVGPFEFKVEQFKELSTLLLQGVRFAGQLCFLIKAVVNSHVALQMAMSKTTLLAVCKLLEMLKTIQTTFEQHVASIAKVMHCILQYLQYKILHLLAACKKKVLSSKLRNRSVDALAAFKIAERCMQGPASGVRILVTKLALDALNTKNRILTLEQEERCRSLIQRIELLTEFQRNLNQICDTSFLYWHQSILSAYLKQIVDRRMDFHSFQYLIQAADSCGKKLDFLNLGNLKLSDSLKSNNFDNIRKEVVSKLCAEIEIFLRLEVHGNLQVERMNPFDQSINDYKDLIDVCPLEVNGNYIILKDHVENYLSAMFYNLTTISLHDWKTYEEMRHLANNRLLLKPVEDYLPNQTLEQGIDILEIMRKIHIFVSKYVYNMNSQIFVEQQSANKHLDTIGIKHMANSLRTHGTGVINTTVNFTYQFLRQKFYTFSQFLYDEQIKARLMKEMRSFAERKQNERYPLYPYERADAFNKDIRKLGLAHDGQTYMDLFRKVITHVGNAMGYIRLVRSGSIHANYNASLYLPKFDGNLQFVKSCESLELLGVTQRAAENLETNIHNLAKSFADNTDYFRLLVEAFRPFFCNPHNMHLKSFFLIVPPLILNYVEYMLAAKVRISKKDRDEAVLFDDGFAVGLAYILKLLDQIGDFNSLQWFVTVRDRFEAERRKIKEMLLEINGTTALSSSKSNSNAAATQRSQNEKLQQTLVLTERRISAHQIEYNLLYYNLCSAKIFFQ